MSHRQLKHSEIKTSQKRHPITIVTDHIHDPQNIGALFRLADAAGIEKLVLITEEENLNFTKIDKISRSTMRAVPHVFCSESELKDHLDLNHQVVSLEWTNKSIPYTDWKPTEATILFLGHERHGVSEKWLNLSNTVVHIPMYGQNSSMNVAMSAGILVYHWIRYF